MLRTILATAILTTTLASTYAPAIAGEGGEGGNGGAMDNTYITMKNPDGTTVTGRYGKTRKTRITRKRNKQGRVVKVTKRHKKFRDRNGRKRSRPYAINHTTGVASIGVRPGLRVVIGRGLGIQFSF